MNMSVHAGIVDYSSDSAKLIEELKSKYPNLDVSQYDKIAKSSIDLNPEIVKYVQAWFVDMFYPEYHKACYADISSPEQTATENNIDQDCEAFVADNPELLLDPDVVPMPPEIRAAFARQLSQVTGQDYTPLLGISSGQGNRRGTRMMAMTAVGDDDDASVGPVMKHFTDDSYETDDIEIRTDDVDSILEQFPPDSLAGTLFGVLGRNVLMGRHVQSVSTISLAKIQQQEYEIMEEMAGLQHSGLKADDPRYSAALEKLKMKMGDLSSSKEQYLSLITQSSQKIQEMVTLLSGFIKDLHSTMSQISNNFRVA